VEGFISRYTVALFVATAIPCQRILSEAGKALLEKEQTEIFSLSVILFLNSNLE
jgi:hypothetical protein